MEFKATSQIGGPSFHFIINTKRRVSFFRSRRWGVENISRNGFKTLDQVQGQGADRRKSAAYWVVCEHFEEACNAVIGP